MSLVEEVKAIFENAGKVVHVKAFGVDVPMKLLPGGVLEPLVSMRIFRDADGKTYMDATGTAENIEEAKKVGVPCDIKSNIWSISFDG